MNEPDPTTQPNSQQTTNEAAAFQKIWMETASKMMQTAFTVSPNSPPPEIVRQMRSGIFQALAQSWEEFMRSPQFLEGMKQWMETAISFRKMTNDFLARARNEVQAPSREDVDTIMLTVRHMETRLLDRLAEIEAQVAQANQRLESLQPAPTRAKTQPQTRQPRTKAAKSNGQARKVQVR